LLLRLHERTQKEPEAANDSQSERDDPAATAAVGAIQCRVSKHSFMAMQSAFHLFSFPLSQAILGTFAASGDSAIDASIHKDLTAFGRLWL